MLRAFLATDAFAFLCAIGFTISLLIAGLAFGEASGNSGLVKLGIMLGSLTSALAGYLVLAGARR